MGNPDTAILEAIKGVTSPEEIKLTQKALEDATVNILPIIKQYVNDLRILRMSLDSEVQHVLQTARQFKDMSRLATEIHELSKEILVFDSLLTPERIERFRRIFGNSSNDTDKSIVG